MIEKVYKMTVGNEKVIERVIADEYIHFNHMILNKGDALPIHFTNSNIYMTVVRGELDIKLAGQQPQRYRAGSILNIPNKTKMAVINKKEETLELIVIKAPAP